VFVFLGIEGASTYSRHAEKREDVGRATVLGFLSVLAIFASVTIVSYGVLPYQQIAALRQPSMAGVLEAAFGSWGAAFVSIGLIVSVLGAYLAWTLMSSEVLYMAAKTGDMPRFLARVSPEGVPTAALVMTTVVVQIILVAVMFVSNALDFALDLTAALSLIPYLFVAAYAVKLAWTRETYGPNANIRRDLIVAGLATVYTLFLVYAAGLKFLLLSFIVYAPATILFVMARREQGRRLFSPVEIVILAITVLGVVVGIAALATGTITL
jgi:arginine:ornithine antiporter / lysine permease